ncbi:hypothetical protein SAMN06295912_15025 [Sphingomonas laterariae]|uniref:Uncharacterized protein n=1 Tax=Edaphosphingomonas laterariae TaxID=861865 RepID=A0A239KDN3_9SPHN|nr:hypothetical protein [Sphingomonas laterariae]SNT16090.1 hypothetical protein SAMN06295912_15025 [Sphingomonas laterariae]
MTPLFPRRHLEAMMLHRHAQYQGVHTRRQFERQITDQPWDGARDPHRIALRRAVAPALALAALLSAFVFGMMAL